MSWFIFVDSKCNKSLGECEHVYRPAIESQQVQTQVAPDTSRRQWTRSAELPVPAHSERAVHAGGNGP